MFGHNLARQMHLVLRHVLARAKMGLYCRGGVLRCCRHRKCIVLSVRVLDLSRLVIF